MKILVAFAGTIENSGGMQNVCIQFINEMIRRAHQVAVAWYGPLNAHTFYPMSQEVRIFTLLPEGVGANKPYHDVGKDISLGNKIVREGLRAFSRKKYREWNDRCKKEIIAPGIRRVIAEYKPDIIISPNQDMTFYLSDNHGDIPVITMLHNTPHYIFSDSYADEIQSLDSCAAIQVLLPSYVREVQMLCPDAEVICIPNIVPAYEMIQRGTKKRHQILNVARFGEQKRQPLLLEAFAKLADKFPEWDVKLLGEGREKPYFKKIEEVITRYHLEKRVLIHNPVKDVLPHYYNADIFAFPSAFEGFPLAMTEAMSTGLPVVAYKNCPGVNEIVENGKDGILVEDGVDAFADGLSKLMQSAALRNTMGMNGHNSMKKYSPDTVWNQWEKLMQRVIGT